MRIRLLPIVIAVAIIAVPARLGNVWQVAQEGGPALAEEKVEADSDDAGDEAEAADGVDLIESGAATSAAILSASSDTGTSTSSGEPAGGASSDGFEAAGFPADPFALTNEELEILQSLAERRAELDQREQEIERRLTILAAAETRIEEKIARLEVLRQRIEGATADSEARHDERIASLSRIYAAMKPKEAAKIFETMEMTVLLDLLSQMRERKSAAILAKMDPNRAQAVTLQLAQREKLPLPKE
jgi:flagellar motility protein MotE (MotC chaperone)